MTLWKNITEDYNKLPDPPGCDDPLVLRIKYYLVSMYEPVARPEEADLTMSTTEIYEAFCSLYHNEISFSREMIAQWLHEQGFQLFDAGSLRFEWLLKRIRG